MKPLVTHRQEGLGSSPWTRRRQVAILLWQIAWPLLCGWTPKHLNPWRLVILRLFGAKLSGRPFVHGRAEIAQPWNLTLGAKACIGDRAVIYSLGPVEIGGRAIVAQEAYLCTGTHDFTSPDLPLQTAPIRVGAGAFLGVRCLVLPGVSIGERAIVGAAAVVTRDVPDEGVVAGNPARLIRVGARNPAGIPEASFSQP